MKEATPMIPTQHDPGNTTAPTASAPVGAGVSVAALYAATAAQPYHSHQASNGRLVDAFYLLPGHAERAEGDYLDAAELSIWHHKDAKCYRATLSASSIRLHGGMFGQRFSLFAARTSTEVLTAQVTRFNTARFAAFTRDVHAAIASQRGPGWGPG